MEKPADEIRNEEVCSTGPKMFTALSYPLTFIPSVVFIWRHRGDTAVSGNSGATRDTRVSPKRPPVRWSPNLDDRKPLRSFLPGFLGQGRILRMVHDRYISLGVCS